MNWKTTTIKYTYEVPQIYHYDNFLFRYLMFTQSMTPLNAEYYKVLFEKNKTVNLKVEIKF